MIFARAALACVLILGSVLARGELPDSQSILTVTRLANLPIPMEGYFLGRADGATLLLGGREAGASEGEGSLRRDIYRLQGEEWERIGELPTGWADGASTSLGGDLVLLGGQTGEGPTAAAMRLSYRDGQVTWSDLPPLPQAMVAPAATALGKTIFVAGGASAGQQGKELAVFYQLNTGFAGREWEQLEPWPGNPRQSASLTASIDRLYLMGGEADGQALLDAYAWHPRHGWRAMASPPYWDSSTIAVSMGESHLMLLGGSPEGDAVARQPIFAYHTITDTWVRLGELDSGFSSYKRAVMQSGEVVVVASDGVAKLEVAVPPTNYGWLDHVAVGLYLMGMVGMGFYFTRQRKSTKDYFRGGNRIPWWATGMSLFATGASAISLLAMPGKAYSTDWTYFAISIYSVLCLPLSMFLLAPLVRKLNVSTAFEYLELRFGLVVRMMGSIIFIVTQVLGRMGPVMLLPAIAMSAITGIDISLCIVVMGATTTLYTYLGGLSAVIWTDTVQGFVMIAAVLGCLLLVFSRIELSNAEIWTALGSADKMHMFDWGWDATYPTVAMVFIGIAMITLFGIGDQNYVQRVQCTPTLKDAKKAIATQMGVAVPINLLLFGLGTALYLFYKQHPESLNPVMKTDGIYPFFAAQQLPPGVSGLVVAALLAATMSTISSSICSVANLGVDDFYRRFKQEATDASAVVLGRVLTAFVGILGIGAALFLAKSSMPSVWDLALLVTNLVSNGVVGLFGLGLLTKRANQKGAIVGVVAGTAFVFALQRHSEITFWLYAFLGSLVTFGVGYLVSRLLPGKALNLDGLTVYTMRLQRQAKASSSVLQEAKGETVS